MKIWSPEDVCPDFNALIADIVEWYVDVYSSGKDEMQKTVCYCAGSIKDFFDAQPTGGASIAQKQFVDALVEIFLTNFLATFVNPPRASFESL